MTKRFTKLFCNLVVLGAALGLAVPALAGVPPTPTATATATAEPTPTATATATAEPTPTATATAEPTATATATATAEPTPTATATVEPTPTATATATAEPTPTATATVEPTPTATATATAEPTPTATATAAPTCSDMWGVTQIVTIGKGQSPSNNPKVMHRITGNIVNPSSLGETAHRIKVCAGTHVDALVSDSTGTPTNSAGGSLSCDSSGCRGVVNVTEKYKSVSSDGKDTDRMTLLPQ